MLVACVLALSGVTAADIYDHDGSIMKPRPAAFNEGGETHLRGQDIVFNLDSHKTTITAITDGFAAFDGELAEALESMTATDEDLTTSIDTLRDETDALKISVNVDFEKFKVDTIAAQNTLQAAFDSGVSSLRAQSIAAGDQMKTDYNAKFATLNSKLSDLSKEVDSKVANLENTVNGQIQNYQNDYNNKINAANAQTATTEGKMTTTTNNFNKYASSTAITWIGGMRGHMYSGWRTMSFDRIELDASGKYFTRHGNYFQIQIAGIYRLSLWGMQYGYGGKRYMVRINGRNMMNEGHNEGQDRIGRYHRRWWWHRDGSARGWWRRYWHDFHIDQTWHFNAGEKIEIRVYSPQYGMHGGTSRANTHNRISFTFLGHNSVKLKM
jgi:hypothetical protein